MNDSPHGRSATLHAGPLQAEQFLASAGEMSERIRAFDWSKTPVGAPAGWPENLRAALSICLRSRFPMHV